MFGVYRKIARALLKPTDERTDQLEHGTVGELGPDTDFVIFCQCRAQSARSAIP
jgi:hypothetical protein